MRHFFPSALVLTPFLVLALNVATEAGPQSALARTSTKVPLPLKKPSSEKQAAKEQAPEKDKLELEGELAGLNELAIGKSEQQTLSDAIKAIYKNKISAARQHKAKLDHPISKKLVEWYTLRSGDVAHDTKSLNKFLKANPGWPSRTRLQAKIERNYLNQSHPAKETVAYFQIFKPKTKAGTIAYAKALLEMGEKDKAIKLIRATYQNPGLSNHLEKVIMAKYASHLRPLDHKIRVDRLLYQDRRAKIAKALRAAKRLGKAEQQAAQFRAAVIRRRHGGAKKLLAKLDPQVKNQPGVYLARVQLARRSKNSKRAAQLLADSKFKAQDIHDKDEWWIERRVNTRAAINDQNYKTAYKIASNHENPSVNRYKEAEFLSGWLALRYLNNPNLAEQHFEKFKKAADGPRSKSKSAYWLGRAQKALKKQEQSQANFGESASFFNTYYGQLAAYELDDKKAQITIPDLPQITPDIAKHFVDRDEIQALVIAHQAGQTSLVRQFFAHLRYHLSDPAELRLLAELAASFGYNQSTVRIGKTAMSQNIPLTEYAYPVRFMPNYKPLRSVPEQAIVYSIARQESEFNYQIKSRAGARGLLQVMPGTLRHVARKYRIKHQTAWLTQKPAFNAKIGSAYIGDRHDEFGGSYIMTFAGFNAGPGRVRQWVRKFGDPRSKHVDPIDWVERIPFTETRNYVQKVLANLQVYRARLANGKSVIKSHQDLYRGKF